MVELYTPRPYQLECFDFCMNRALQRGRIIIADEMGLGKTGEALLCARVLVNTLTNPRDLVRFAEPTLLLGGSNTQAAWATQMPHWGVAPFKIIEGSPGHRARLWRELAGSENKFVACTRETFHRDLKSGIAPKSWKLIIPDEAHKDTNRNTHNHKNQASLESLHFIYITGSPMRRGPQNLWALLNVLYPKQYRSYWRFVEKYCVVIRERFGWHVEGSRNTHELAKELSRIMIRRTKNEVAEWMPDKTRIGVEDDLILEMVDGQKQVYEAIAEDMLAALPGGDFLITPTVLAQCVRLRQALVCPRILDPGLPDGAAIDDLVQKLADADDTHCVIFSPFSDAFPFVEERLEKEGYDPRRIFWFKGGSSAGDLQRQLEAFRAARGIALCTIAYAESFDFYPASWAYYLGFEWDPLLNAQSEDRIHRAIVGSLPPTYYFPTHRGGIDRDTIRWAVEAKVKSVSRVWASVRGLRKSLQQKA